VRVTSFQQLKEFTTKLTGSILNSSAGPKGVGHGCPELQSRRGLEGGLKKDFKKSFEILIKGNVVVKCNA
jgi:hypothetical protein